VIWLDSAGHPASGRGGGLGPRDGSAASHLEGLVLSMQAGPPPSSRARHGALGRPLWQQPARPTCHSTGPPPR
jgi:hypothetical protein